MQPLRQLPGDLAGTMEMVGREEALHQRALDEQAALHPWAGHDLTWELTDRAADGDPSADVRVLEHAVEHRPADGVEIDIDAVRAGRGDRGGKVGRVAIVQALVESEF